MYVVKTPPQQYKSSMALMAIGRRGYCGYPAYSGEPTYLDITV